MTSPIARWRIGFARLDYVRSVHWAAHSEDYGDCIVLEVETRDGQRGATETIVRAKWHDATPAQVESSLIKAVLPALAHVDWTDPEKVGSTLAPYRKDGFACALADLALWDLRASAANTALWKLLGATASRVPVSFTLTRTGPAIMAREAAEMRDLYGFTAFKVKTGQGIDIDRRAIAAIRAAVGEDVVIMADSNRAHELSEVRAMSEMLTEAGVVWFEDPCAYTADESFVAAQAQSVLPILVDNQSRSQEAARVFTGLGAKGLSVKTMKTGITESRQVIAHARESGAKVAVGISASGGGGAVHTLSLAASIPADQVCLLCEETFFLYLRNDLLTSSLQVRDGAVELADHPCVAPLIDWRRMDRLVSGVC
jgi:L-alanine-DL-glutamate epimerase-like enolase superfamily enzyme